MKHQAELHQSFLRALNSRASSSSSPDSQEPTNNTNAEGQESEKGRSDSTVDYTEILAGFEKVAAPSESGGATDLDATQIPLWSTVDTALPLGAPETPTMTSKSFDDFHLHRFLGQGIPSMPNLARGEQNNAPTGENGRGGVKPRPIAVATLNGPATEALHGARDGNSAGDISFNIDASEDYSLLAQQSVLAAMQHSAYAAPLKTKEAGNTSKKKNSRTFPRPTHQVLPLVNPVRKELELPFPLSAARYLPPHRPTAPACALPSSPRVNPCLIHRREE